jgi:hypothetical protein
MTADHHLRAADEARHVHTDDPWWAESWSFDVWDGGGTGLCTNLTVLPNQSRCWYWAAVVRPEQPLLYLHELDARLPRTGLEVRAEGLWASHECEAPFEQWTVANEASAVALDDAAEALGRGLGLQVPVAFDLEWYAEGPPVSIQDGYEQAGSVEGVVELAEGPQQLEGVQSRRHHRWGVVAPAPGHGGLPPGSWVPFAVAGPGGPEVLDRVLTTEGWWEGRRPG